MPAAAYAASLLADAPPACTAPLTTHDFWQETQLGQGSYGAVALVRHEASGRYFALKSVDKALVRRRRHAACLVDEVRATALAAGAPHVAALVATFEDEGHLHLLLEAAPDGPLLPEGAPPLDRGEVARRLAELAAALAFLHEKCLVAHRDVAPGNVLSGSDGAVRLCDFGVAACLETPGDRRRTICGTPGYVAPEVKTPGASGYAPFAADLWSFGAFCRRALVGEGAADDASAIPHAADLLRRLSDPAPAARPDHAALRRHPFFGDAVFPRKRRPVPDPPAGAAAAAAPEAPDPPAAAAVPEAPAPVESPPATAPPPAPRRAAAPGLEVRAPRRRPAKPAAAEPPAEPAPAAPRRKTRPNPRELDAAIFAACAS